MRNIVGYIMMSALAVRAMVMSSVQALSCVTPLPTFDTMKASADIVVRGKVVSHTIRNPVSTPNYCPQKNVARELGTHVYTIQIDKVIKGSGSVSTQTIEVTRDVTGLHCTRGGACLEMQVGQSYVILTDDKKRIMDGLCKASCPYMAVSAYDAIYHPQPTEPIMCTEQYDPVCGKDGVTYSNACVATRSRATVAYTGECQCVITQDYAPVCGVDGMTYTNYSAARCKNIRVAHEGACITPHPARPPHPQTPPVNCTSWFDGCNTCAVGPNNELACTRMACVTKKQPQCLAYRYTYLTADQEKAIEQAVPGIVKNVGVPELKRRIITLREKVQYTLATSMFVKGSPELREQLLILELLQKIETLL